MNIAFDKSRWAYPKLSELCEIRLGKTPPRKDKECWGQGNIWITISDLNNGKYISDSREKITDYALRKGNYYQIQPGTVILSFKLTLGKVSITQEIMYSNEAIAALPIIDEKRISRDFLYIILQTIDYRRLSVKAVKGATLNKQKLKKIVIPLPPLQEQEKIIELFEIIDQSFDGLDSQERNIVRLKKGVLEIIFSTDQSSNSPLQGKDYEIVRFDSIAKNISDRIEPQLLQDGVYVGLEHLDSDDLIIRRKGKSSDVIGTKLKISCGDVIFGKRRAYLRKVAVSDFDGIVSAHSMVLRAIEEKIEKNFLPYFMQSDEFMNRAISISEGSLSPTIKWKVLAVQEFSLPKKEKQAEFINLFSRLDQVRETIRKQKENIQKLKNVLLYEIFN